MKYLWIFLLPVIGLCSETYYIKPKAYLDVVNGKMISGKIIGITGDKITSISGTSPSGQKIIFSNLYLMPGLIDCHTHIFFTQYISDKDFEKALIREIALSDEFRSSRARMFLDSYLRSGFTSVCDLGNSGNFLDVKLRDQIKSDSNYPDLFVSGPGLATSKGQFDSSVSMENVKKEYIIVDGKTDLDLILKKYSDLKVDILKVYVDNSPGTGLMDSATISRILKSPFSKNFKKITFHALEPEAFKILSTFKEGLSFEHGNSIGWTTIKDKKKTFLTLTDLPKNTLEEFSYYNKLFYNIQILRAREAFKNNIQLVFGSDFYFHKDEKAFDRGKYVIHSIDAWTEASIPNEEILKALTINAARSLHSDGFFGAIKVGYKANIIGLKNNPVTDIKTLENVELIINKGVVKDTPQKKK